MTDGGEGAFETRAFLLLSPSIDVLSNFALLHPPLSQLQFNSEQEIIYVCSSFLRLARSKENDCKENN